ncbi:MAG: hypothetical protein ACOCZA_13290 [Spirochaetota bacterium]
MALKALFNYRRAAALTIFSAGLTLLFLTADLWAYPGDEDIIVAEFWTELDPIIEGRQPGTGGSGSSEEERPSPVEPIIGTGVISQEEAIRRTLEEARVVFSGMIYGFNVRYTPSDRDRQVEEELVIEPLAQIPKGDPSLHVLKVRTTDNQYFVHMRYNLAAFQQRRLQAWDSNTLAVAAGRGTAPLYGGYRAKFDSFDQAIKNALREYLRPRYRNKPSRIQAAVALQDPPYTVIDAGGYHSKVRIKVDIREVQPYSAY